MGQPDTQAGCPQAFCKHSSHFSAAPSAEGSANTHLVKEEVLRAAEDIIKERMASLVGFCRQNDCDLFYAKKLLYQHNYDKYVLFKEDLLSVMTENFDIQIKSVR